MRAKKERSKLLRSWVDRSKPSQGQWIVEYLSKKNDKSPLADYLMGRESLVEAQYSSAVSGTKQALEQMVLDKIMDDHSSYLIQNDLSSQKLMRSMRGAWQQKKYRENNGKQVNIMLPNSLVSEVDKVARDRDQSMAYTLEQMVAEAADTFQAGSRRLAKRVAALEKRLEDAKDNSLAIESTLGQWVDVLLKAVARETVARCEYEAIGDDGEKPDDDLFNHLLEMKIADLEAEVPALRPRRSQFKRVKDYFSESVKG